MSSETKSKFHLTERNLDAKNLNLSSNRVKYSKAKTFFKIAKMGKIFISVSQ